MKKNIHLKRNNCFYFNSRATIVFISAILFMHVAVNAQTQIIDKYCFNSGVSAIAKAPNGGTFIGGSFTLVAEHCGNSVRLDTNNAPGFNINDVRVKGQVRAIVSIPGGGWYIGGSFISVGGVPRSGLARINADGSLHAFNPSGIYLVQSLAIDSFGKLYVGGFLTNSYGIICFNPNGTPTSFNQTFDSIISTLVLDSSGNLYAGGYFTSPRNRLAKFNADGTLSSFSAVFNTGYVSSIVCNTGGEILVGGSFTTVNGNSRSRFAKFNADTTLNNFNPVFNGNVEAIAVDDSGNFYVGGTFTTINTISRGRLAKFDSTGILMDFDPVFDSTVSALRFDSLGALYVGGFFTLVGNAYRRYYFAKFDANGNLNTYNPAPNGVVLSIAIDALGIVRLGGSLTGMKSITRNRLALLNADGSLNSFNPNMNNPSNSNAVVYALAVDGLGNLYAGGSFTTPRNHLAKFNINLTLESFSVSGAGTVYDLAIDSANNLYVGGSPEVVQGRGSLVKFNSNGTLNSFDPDIFGAVCAIVVDGQNNLYISGAFNTVLGQARHNFAKLNANGTLAGMNPDFDSTVYSLALDNSGNIYAGGAFSLVNDQPRTNLAKLDADGTLNSFSHALNGNVRSILATAAGNVYIGGEFYLVDGIQKNGYAKLNPNGTVNNFNLVGVNNASDIVLIDDKLHIGGGASQRYEVYTNGDTTCNLTLSNPVPESRCGTGSVTLSITPSSGTVNWYDAPTNGNLVATGTTFTTPIISSTTAYYAQAVDGACVSFSRTEVLATVLPTQTCASTVNLKLFIQGYFEAGVMRPVKFNQDGISPTTDVEDITVKLQNAAEPYAVIDTTTALLKTDGTAVCTFSTAPVGSFYIVVSTQSAIKTWSATPVLVGPTALFYDFSTGVDKAYGNNMVQLAPGVFGFYSGDFNQDGVIDNKDAPNLYNDIDASAFGILSTDLNGDGTVDNADAPIYYNNSEGSIYSHDPYYP